MPIATMWKLTEAWYRDRLARDFTRRPAREYQAMLADVGLVDDFWKLE